MASSHPPDCPWDAHLLLDEQQQQKKKKDTKKIRDSGNGQLKKQQERSEYLMRAVPVSMEATIGVNVGEDEKGELLERFHCIHCTCSQLCVDLFYFRA